VFVYLKSFFIITIRQDSMPLLFWVILSVIVLSFLLNFQKIKNRYFPSPPKEIPPPVAVLPVEPLVEVSKKLDIGITTKCSELSQFLADIGTVTPLEVYSEDYFIFPYQKTEPFIQEQVVHSLRELNPEITHEYIKTHWSTSDILYVMTSPDTKFIGCMAVDRKNFYPFISHLYVTPEYRKKGFGERLLTLGEDYAKEFKFNEVKLWCKKILLPYYTKRGWKVESKTKDSEEKEVWVLKKQLL
jgi:GNAT superfamily N-acetyltransferase